MEEFEIRDTRTKEKFVIDDVYLNGYAKHCGINATGVYISLCRHVDKKQKCFPSKKLIAKELGISESSVFRALKKLESYGIIRTGKQLRNDLGTFMHNVYTLLDKSLWGSNRRSQVPTVTQTDTVGHRDINRRSHRPTKDTHKKDTHRKESSFLKPYYEGYEMRLTKKDNKWWVLVGVADWKEFAGKEKDIVWK